jgi:hypothetical protein
MWTASPSGFFGTALQTTDGSIIVAFEGTDLGDFEDNPQFVVAGLAPAAATTLRAKSAACRWVAGNCP